MRYSIEFKMLCVEMHKLGLRPETPAGISTKTFMRTISQWVRMEKEHGPDVFKPKQPLPAEERIKLIKRVLAGESIYAVAMSAGIFDGTLSKWVRKYKKYGYNGMRFIKADGPSKEKTMKEINSSKPKKINYNNYKKINETEYAELVRLRIENQYIKAELEVIKKEIALREEKEAARLKAKKQQSSRNSIKKDTP